MKTEIMATVLDGCLKPDQTLTLPERTRVKVTIEGVDTRAMGLDAWKAIESRLEQRPVNGGGRRFTRDELHERD